MLFAPHSTAKGPHKANRFHRRERITGTSRPGFRWRGTAGSKRREIWRYPEGDQPRQIRL